MQVKVILVTFQICFFHRNSFQKLFSISINSSRIPYCSRLARPTAYLIAIVEGEVQIIFCNKVGKSKNKILERWGFQYWGSDDIAGIIEPISFWFLFSQASNQFVPFPSSVLKIHRNISMALFAYLLFIYSMLNFYSLWRLCAKAVLIWDAPWSLEGLNQLTLPEEIIWRWCYSIL